MCICVCKWKMMPLILTCLKAWKICFTFLFVSYLFSFYSRHEPHFHLTYSLIHVFKVNASSFLAIFCCNVKLLFTFLIYYLRICLIATLSSIYNLYLCMHFAIYFFIHPQVDRGCNNLPLVNLFTYLLLSTIQLWR